MSSLDIAALRTAFESGAATPVDVIRSVYRRIAAIGERPIWISLRDEADALKAAEIAPRGALYGIPFAVKDNIDVAGLATTCACPSFAYTPTRSARVVELLEAAGAIVIGKTNLDQFATGLVGTRSPYGIPRSPFNDAYISGGSSSGSAVAVSRGLVAFALGTDTAGSGRVPAGFNNIVGLKPTKGLISTRGVVPACRSLDCVSVFALTVSDAIAVTQIAAAFDAEDIFARKTIAKPFNISTMPAKLRIGVPNAGLQFFGDTAAEALYRTACQRAVTLGAELMPFDYAPFEEAARLLYAGPWVAERTVAAGDFIDAGHADIDPTVGAIISRGTQLTARAAFAGHYALNTLIRATEPVWHSIDMMLLPTSGTTYTVEQLLADPVQLNSNLGATTNFVNLMDLSALAVPAGFRDNGLPFGVTLIGPALHDGRLASFGDHLHRAVGGALGATSARLDATPALCSSVGDPNIVAVAVVGAHLTGQPLHWQLTERNARLLETTRTGKGYSLYALANTSPPKPGLVFDGDGEGGIAVEVWQMGAEAFGTFVNQIPAPLGIGTITLEDGSSVQSFLCEAHAVQDAADITSFGGWRAWLASR